MSYNPPSGGWPPRPQDSPEGDDRAPGSPWSSPSYSPPPSSSAPGWPSSAQSGQGQYTGSNAPGAPSYQPSSGYGAPPPPPGYGAGYPQYGYGAGYGYAAPKTDGTAIAALVLSIASFVVCFGVPAVVALALIPSARRHIAASNGTVEGTTLLTAAKWIAIVNLILVGIGIVVIVIAAIVAGNSSNSNSTAGSLAMLLLR